MAITRSALNPIISPKDVKPSMPGFQVIYVINAGVTRFADQVLLLLRVAEIPINHNQNEVLIPVFDPVIKKLVIRQFNRSTPGIDLSDPRFVRTPTEQYLTSISHFRIARSNDGLNFTIDEKPAMFPANLYEKFGIEDPRITFIDDTYFINYSAISDESGVTTCLASTKDFKTFSRHGVIFTPDNKDITIFPRKIGGKYYALNRPASCEYKHRYMWISESPDLICWGNHQIVMSSRQGFWDNGRIGCSAVPFQIPQGWLEIYHGASKDDRYCLGAVLLDQNQPWKVLGRSSAPILQPEMDYELKGFFGNVVFSCGALFEDAKVKIYYGAADTVMAYAEIGIDEMINLLA
jgi:beta-1,2-mannobiose phosphorylase / 1,2-beta-oligomannan phosphorylase